MTQAHRHRWRLRHHAESQPAGCHPQLTSSRVCTAVAVTRALPLKHTPPCVLLAPRHSPAHLELV